jgi:hypothetical protein
MKMMRDDDWNRCYISLVSEAKPRLRDRDGDNQEVRLWEALKELGGKRLTLDEIVKQCAYRRFQTNVPLRNSAIWHLKALATPERNIVKIEF